MAVSTVWGTLDQVHDAGADDQWVLVRTVLQGGVAIRMRALIGKETTVARGSERIHLSNLAEGELVELTYHHSHEGFMEAETICALQARSPSRQAPEHAR